FFDHFSQATLFYRSQSEVEQNHIVRALRFELGKVETPPIRERMLYLLAQVDTDLANRVAVGLGLTVPKKLDKPLNMSVPADGDARKFQPKKPTAEIEPSPALRMVDNPNFAVKSIKTRKIAFLVADGFNDTDVSEMKMTLMKAGAVVMTVAPRLGVLTGVAGDSLNADCSLLTGASVLFDAVYVPDGEASVAALQAEHESLNFLSEAYRHCKTIAASGAGVELLAKAGLPVPVQEDAENGSAREDSADPGVVTSRDGNTIALAENFILSIARHRHWERELLWSTDPAQMPGLPASKRARASV
ncbi:MAG TPA: catalase-related domain-containing protein, partial [Pyrinomonadaceae bacterium]|nr:catalase-related domain-containing protein [Pyrinomonadaceae bacterium]